MKIHLTHIATAIAICALVLVTEADAAGFTRGRETAPLSPEFKTGDYVWKPEASPAGPVVIIVRRDHAQTDPARRFQKRAGTDRGDR